MTVEGFRRWNNSSDIIRADTIARRAAGLEGNEHSGKINVSLDLVNQRIEAIWKCKMLIVNNPKTDNIQNNGLLRMSQAYVPTTLLCHRQLAKNLGGLYDVIAWNGFGVA